MNQLRSRSRPEAMTRLQQSLALEEIAKHESLQVTPEELADRIKEVQAQLEGRDVDQARLREFVESDLSKEKALKWLEEHATLELVPKGSLKKEQEETETQVLEADPTVTVSQQEETQASVTGTQASTPEQPETPEPYDTALGGESETETSTPEQPENE